MESFKRLKRLGYKHHMEGSAHVFTRQSKVIEFFHSNISIDEGDVGESHLTFLEFEAVKEAYEEINGI